MGTSAIIPAGEAARWAGFLRAALIAALLAVGLSLALLVWADPFGLRQRPGVPARALLDSNQRFMFPQLVRSRQADGVILGTSSVKLIDPERLGRATGLSPQNLAMNAATPWEQTQLFGLIRREGGVPRLLVWGLDTTWCEADATSPAKQRTPRPFPEWLYDESSWRDLPASVSLTSLEIAARRLPEIAGQAVARIRADGYDEFTPPDASYDPARARFHLFHGRASVAIAPSAPLALPVPAPPDLARFPALAWLQAELEARQPETAAILLLPPVHAASLPAGETDARCKASIRAVARAAGAAVMDYRFASALAVRDDHFWDPLHYRTGIAAGITDDVAAVALGRHPEGGTDQRVMIERPAAMPVPR